MAGIIGVYPFGEGRDNWDVSRFIFYGLSALQSRGQETAGVVSYTEENGLRVAAGEGLVDEVCTEDRLSEHRGFLGIGQTSPIERDFPVHVKHPVELTLVGDGKPATHGDKVSAFQTLAETLSKRLSEGGSTVEAAMKLVGDVGGGYSFIALTERQEIICGRDRLGVKPLEVGSAGFDLGAVASESCAFDVMGMEHSPDYVKPGEVVVFDPMSIERRCVGGCSCSAFCSFEYVYLARADSVMNGVPVYGVRERIGEKLAEEYPMEADVVIGVPETAIPFAMRYSAETGIPVKMGFVRTGRHVRSAIRPTQFERLMGVQLKLNPIRSSVDNRDVVLIDDSVVRGNTTKNTVGYLRRKGARKVHVLIGSPRLIAQCPYGTEVPPEDELIGRSLNPTETAEIVGADTFAHLSVEGLVDAIGLEKSGLCLGCFTGRYPA